jgi:hypothetical protein
VTALIFGFAHCFLNSPSEDLEYRGAIG